LKIQAPVKIFRRHGDRAPCICLSLVSDNMKKGLSEQMRGKKISSMKKEKVVSEHF
jgi:hypothetical protein